jgi:hypothetical protein
MGLLQVLAVIALLFSLNLCWVYDNPLFVGVDTYYHLGCARLYGSLGWLASFPWLKYTILGEHFPNVHWLLHMVLAPLTWVFSPAAMVKVGVAVMNTALSASQYLVLRRWQVPYAWLWALLGAYSSPLLVSLGTGITGAGLFFVLLVWFIDALWRGNQRMVLLCAWLCMYSYTGAPILLALAGVLVLSHGMMQGRWQWQLLVATAAGIAGGMLFSPFFPHNLVLIGHEVSAMLLRDQRFQPGEFFGAWWKHLESDDLLRFTFGHLALWAGLLTGILGRGKRLDASLLAGAVLALGLFGVSLAWGAKLLHVFYLLSLLFAALLATRSGPWPKWVQVLVMVAAVGNGLWSARQSWRDLHQEGASVSATDYEGIAGFLHAHTQEKETVLAAWDDFPGLFNFNNKNTYVVGMNPYFLYWQDAKRFEAYYQLFKGRVSDPENLLPTFFADTRYIVLRRKPRNQGEYDLIKRLSTNGQFSQPALPGELAVRWQVFKLKG